MPYGDKDDFITARKQTLVFNVATGSLTLSLPCKRYYAVSASSKHKHLKHVTETKQQFIDTPTTKGPLR